MSVKCMAGLVSPLGLNDREMYTHLSIWFKQYLFHQIFQHLYNFHRKNTGSDGKQCLYLSHLLIHSGKKNKL